MKTRLTKFVCCLIMSIFMVSGLALPKAPATAPIAQFIGASQANAQQPRRKAKNLFQLLFDRKKRESRRNTPRTPPPKAKSRSVRPKATRRTERPVSRTRRAASATVGASAAAVAATAQKADKVEKNPNAAKVLVVGDFIADRLANGLTDRFQSDPNVIFIDSARSNSGLVRDDVFNWPENIDKLIEDNQPKLIIVAVGMNDRQQMRLASGSANNFSDVWREEYEKRVDAILSAARKRNVQLIWVGLPPVRVRSMNADYLQINEIFRTKTEAAGFKYIDIWDGFTDAEGNFVTAGPDVNGQIVRLRLNDGINFTKAGRDKLAFYVERPVRTIIGLGASEIAALPNGVQLPDAPANTDAAQTGRTALMSLDGAGIDGGSQLDGAGDFIVHSEEALRAGTNYELVVKGTPTKPVPGRVDAAWGEATVNKTPAPPKSEPAKANADSTNN